MPFSAHPAIGQNLRNSVFCCLAFFQFVSLAHRPNEVSWVVVGDVLEGVGNALDQVFLFDIGHKIRSILIVLSILRVCHRAIHPKIPLW